MTEERGEASGKLWAFLLKAGGYWRAVDVARELREDSVYIRQLMVSMARNGSLRRFDSPEQGIAYGVTGACTVPRCVTVQLIAECVMSPPPDEGAA